MERRLGRVHNAVIATECITENDEKNIMDVLTGKRSLEDVIKKIKHKYMVEKE